MARSDGPPRPVPHSNILRLPAVKTRTGLGKSTIYLLIKKKRFPQQVVLSTRAVGWYEHDIDDWARSRRNAAK
ncbi:AlpA family phage regulatory protein [Piscinibacter sp. HJYY11]|nr:AlpA family phage regulatory protein [Piscinibacter sp. HJYY11]